MAEHVDQTCDGGNGLWLPLTEYSVRSGISTSTIRRKIKSNSIPHRLENGKYLLLYYPADSSGFEVHEEDTVIADSLEPMQVESSYQPRPNLPRLRDQRADDSLAIPVMEKAVEMVSEAFEHSLDEKDKRIILLERQNADLKERLDELKTLVQVLEEKYQVRY